MLTCSHCHKPKKLLVPVIWNAEEERWCVNCINAVHCSHMDEITSGGGDAYEENAKATIGKDDPEAYVSVRSVSDSLDAVTDTVRKRKLGGP